MIGHGTESSPVLIVDDDELARYALASLLQRSGVDVICATTPYDAHRAGACAVIVSELRLTGQTEAEGQSLLGELRSRRPASPIVIFSSFITATDTGEPMNGTVASLSKSTPLREVAAAIRDVLQDQQRGAAGRAES